MDQRKLRYIPNTLLFFNDEYLLQRLRQVAERRSVVMRGIKAAALLLAVLLAAQVAGSASTPMSKSDALSADLLPHSQAFFADPSEFEVLARKLMSRTYSVILVHARAPSNKLPLSSPESFKQESFGLFVIDNASGRLHMPVDIFATKRWSDYEVILEEVDERRVDIRRQGATYGDVADRVSYFLDIGSKKVLGAVTHHGMNIYAMAMFQGALYFVGTGDLQTTTLAKLSSPRSNSTGLSGFEVVDRIDGQRIQMIRRASVSGDRLILTGESTRYVLARGGWAVMGNPEAALFTYNSGAGRPVGVPFISFWVPLYMVQEHLVSVPAAGRPPRRFLVWNSRISANSSSPPFKSPRIYEIAVAHTNFINYPSQPTTSSNGIVRSELRTDTRRTSRNSRRRSARSSRKTGESGSA